MSHEGVSEHGVVYLRNCNVKIGKVMIKHDKPTLIYVNMMSYHVISMNEEPWNPQISQILVMCAWEIQVS